MDIDCIANRFADGIMSLAAFMGSIQVTTTHELATLENLISQLKNREARDKLLSTVCLKLVSVGNYSKAVYFSESIEGRAEKNFCSLVIAKSAAAKGETRYAIGLPQFTPSAEDYDEIIKAALVANQTDTTARQILLSGPPEVMAKIAVKYDLLEIAETCLSQIQDINCRNSNYIMCTEIAVVEQHWDTANRLLGKVTDSECKGNYCRRAIVEAVQNGQQTFAKMCWAHLKLIRQANDDVCVPVAYCACNAGYLDFALEFALLIENVKRRQKILQDLASAAAFKGLWQTLGVILGNFQSRNLADRSRKRSIVNTISTSISSSGCSRCPFNFLRALPDEILELLDYERFVREAMGAAPNTGQCTRCHLTSDDSSASTFVATRVEPDEGRTCNERLLEEESERAGLILPIADALVKDTNDKNLKNGIRSQTAQTLATGKLGHSANFFADQIDNAALRDECLLKVADCAVSQDNSQISTVLLRKVSDESMRHEWCSKTATVLSLSGKYNEARDVLQEIADVTFRDEKICDLASVSLRNGSLETAMVMIKDITEPAVREKICLDEVKLAIWQGHLLSVTQLLECLDRQVAKDRVCYAAVQIAVRKNQYIAVDFLLRSITDSERRHSYCTELLEMMEIEAGHETAWQLLDFLPYDNRPGQLAAILSNLMPNDDDLKTTAKFLIGSERLISCDQDWDHMSELFCRTATLFVDQSRKDEFVAAAILMFMHHNQWNFALKFESMLPSSRESLSLCVHRVLLKLRNSGIGSN